ncbi:hypothetical protein LCGC14_1240780 [marine sediment metagenome]|uniref:Uncharacterized protein n=1 Tax=marine sediment metagenome TaxID=412755 RepID=A0A0F9L9Y2_9ZZZZ
MVTVDDNPGRTHTDVGEQWRQEMMVMIKTEIERRDPNLTVLWAMLGPEYLRELNRQYFGIVVNTMNGKFSGDSGLTRRLTITRKDTGEVLVDIHVDLVFRESKHGHVPVTVPRPEGEDITIAMVKVVCSDRWVWQFTGTALPEEEGRHIITLTECRLHPLHLYPEELMHIPISDDKTKGHVLVDSATVVEPWHPITPTKLGIRTGLFEYAVQRVQDIIAHPVKYEKSRFGHVPKKRREPPCPRMKKLRD